jgi:hypothetical protein
MSLDLSVLMKERLTNERLTSLHAFLTKRKFVKQRLGPSSFFYFSTKPNISIDVFLIKAPIKGNDFWEDLYENGESVGFPPKSAITMESRHTEASHLKAYSLGKALARRFGGIIYDHQMSTVYSARGKPICDPGGKEESLRYGAAIAPFMRVVAEFMEILGARQMGKTPRRKKMKGSVAAPRHLF